MKDVMRYSHANNVAFFEFLLRYLEHSMKHRGRMTLQHDLMSSCLLAVVKSSHIISYFLLPRVC